MTCPAATGPSTLVADASCSAPKTEFPGLNLIEKVSVESVADTVKVFWSQTTPIPPYSPAYQVMVMYREAEGSIYERVFVPVGDELVTIPGLDIGGEYTFWVREQSSGSYNYKGSFDISVGIMPIDFSKRLNAFNICLV